jgi:hypothetical protein
MIFSSGWPVIISESWIWKCPASEDTYDEDGRGTHEDAPNVDEDEQDEVEDAVHGEEEYEEVIRHGLEVTVDGVEGMRGERRGNFGGLSSWGG